MTIYVDRYSVFVGKIPSITGDQKFSLFGRVTDRSIKMLAHDIPGEWLQYTPDQLISLGPDFGFEAVRTTSLGYVFAIAHQIDMLDNVGVRKLYVAHYRYCGHAFDTIEHCIGLNWCHLYFEGKKVATCEITDEVYFAETHP